VLTRFGAPVDVAEPPDLDTIQSGTPGVWKLPDLWTHRTRPPAPWKPQNGFTQASTRLIILFFHRRGAVLLSEGGQKILSLDS